MTALEQQGHRDREAALGAVVVTFVVLDSGKWCLREQVTAPPASREIRVHGSTALNTQLRRVSSATVVVVPPGGEEIVSPVATGFSRVAMCGRGAKGGSSCVGDELARAVRRARRLSPAGLVMLDPAWPDDVPGTARQFILSCLSDDLDGMDAGRLAGRCGVSLRTLERDHQEVGIQPPRRVLALGRALRMSWMLQAPGQTLDPVAEAVGLSGGVVAGRVLRREGFTAGAIRTPGGLDWVQRHVMSALFTRRHGEAGNGEGGASAVTARTE